MKRNLEDELARRLDRAGLLEAFERQVRFRAGLMRKWRFDFYSHHDRLALEVEGGTFSGGRHSRGAGMQADMEKYNEAVLHGIRVLRFDGTMIAEAPIHKKPPKTKKVSRQRALEGVAVDMVRRALDYYPQSTEFKKRPRK